MKIRMYSVSNKNILKKSILYAFKLKSSTSHIKSTNGSSIVYVPLCLSNINTREACRVLLKYQYSNINTGASAAPQCDEKMCKFR